MPEPTATRDATRKVVDTVIANSVAGIQGSRLALTPTEFVSVIYQLALHDGSLGWLTAMRHAGAEELAALSGSAANEVWSANPEAPIAVGYRGEGNLTGNRRLTGRWPAVAGADDADWLLLSVDDASGWVLVARSHAQIDSGHHHPGLDDAGLVDVTITKATVDADHIFPRRSVHGAAIAAAGAAAAVVGAAGGMWQGHVERVRARLATSHGGDEVTDDASAQLAGAACDIDAAKLQITDTVQRSAGPAASTWAYRQAIVRARDAADRLLSIGRHALDDADPVSRRWRDVHAGYRLTVPLLNAEPDQPQ